MAGNGHTLALRHGCMAAACAALALAGGCRSYDQKLAPIRDAYVAGQYARAADQAVGRARDNEQGRDGLIWALEAAMALRCAGRWDEYEAMLESADKLYVWQSEQASVRLGSEALALLTNPANLPYTGRAYDGIMISVYQALEALRRDDAASARVYLRRAYLRQQDAVAQNAAQIERSQNNLKRDARAEQTIQNERFSEATQQLFCDIDGMAAYADYVNPFAVYVVALFHLHYALDNDDLQAARQGFDRLMAFASGNPYVREDHALAQQGTAETRRQGRICYVLFETGMAPYRVPYRIDLPLIGTRVAYVGVSFPMLQRDPAYIADLDVIVKGRAHRAMPVADMDAVVATDFNAELPAIITRVVVSSLSKMAVSYAADKAVRQSGADEWVEILVQVLGAVLQYTVNVADTRTWNSLPKQMQVCKVLLGNARSITLAAPGYGWRREVPLEDGRVVFVVLRGTRDPHQMTISQFSIK